ncbi:MAG: sugar ABC transporter permease [Proteobacteria bacterium]|nr:sugar ABC transporter permease [Pseudomonadota bacterium]
MSSIEKVGRGQSLFTHAFLWAACLVALFPVSRIITISLRPGNRLLSSDMSLIPDDATLASYFNIVTQKPFLQWLYNSLLITMTTSLIGVALAASAAYAFARYTFPGRKSGLLFLMTTQMIPGAMLLLPIYLVLTKLGLNNTYTGLVVAYSVTTLPFSIWILKGYFDTVPRSLEEAARIDGCTEFGAFYRILLPLSKPSLAIVFLFNFTQAWNEYLVASTILQDPRLRTWPLGLYELQGNFNSEWGLFAAGSVLISVPVVLLFLYSSKYMISGLTLGGVKG